jgi:hypothetical protein
MIHLAPSDEGFEGTIQGGPNEQELELDALFTGPNGRFHNARESISISDVSPWVETTLRSVDGQLKLDIPQASVAATGRIAVRQMHRAGPELAGWQLTAGPFHLFATFGEELSQAARLQMRPGGAVADPEEESSFLLMRLNAAGKSWEAVETTAFHGAPLAVTTHTTQLGIYALFSKAYDVEN